MNLLLFETAEGHAFFVGERTHGSRQHWPEHVKETRWSRLKHQVGSAYERLKEQFDYSERLCGSLRHAEAVHIVHSPRSSSQEAEKKLRNFLEMSYSKHSRWLAVDGALACLGGGLFWVPGPNVFFFYPAVRALSHYFARRGAAQAMHLKPTFELDDRLDLVQDNLENLESCTAVISELEESYNLENLLKTLKSMRRK